MSVKIMELPAREQWDPERAEELLSGLEAVEAARIVLGKSGRLDEVHILATDALPAKQVVRSVESALFLHFGRNIDHRKVSVAQIQTGKQTRTIEPPTATPPPSARAGDRMVLLGFQATDDASQRLTSRVSIGWKGKRFEGTADGVNVARTRLETFARATLGAIEAAAHAELETEPSQQPTFQLDGVAVVGDRSNPTVAVRVSAMNDLEVTPLTGVVRLEADPGRAVILATLRATDRWVRGQVERLES